MKTRSKNPVTLSHVKFWSNFCPNVLRALIICVLPSGPKENAIRFLSYLYTYHSGLEAT